MTVDQMNEFERAMAFRRKVENQAPPKCPECGELVQIQLRHPWHAEGALYRCRICKHKFHGPDKYQRL